MNGTSVIIWGSGCDIITSDANSPSRDSSGSSCHFVHCFEEETSHSLAKHSLLWDDVLFYN